MSKDTEEGACVCVKGREWGLEGGMEEKGSLSQRIQRDDAHRKVKNKENQELFGEIII